MGKIVNISEAVSIALHGMVIIAQSSEQQVNVNVIAERAGSSKFHVAKVMQKLAKDGFLGSHRGPSGGFFLIKSPLEIKLIDIYEAIEGKLIVSQCPINRPICPFDTCIFGNVTTKMVKQFKEFIEKKTLADYIGAKYRKGNKRILNSIMIHDNRL